MEQRDVVNRLHHCASNHCLVHLELVRFVNFSPIDFGLYRDFLMAWNRVLAWRIARDHLIVVVRDSFQVDARDTLLVDVDGFREALHPDFTFDLVARKEHEFSLQRPYDELLSELKIYRLFVLTLEDIDLDALNLQQVTEGDVFASLKVVTLTVLLELNDAVFEVDHAELLSVLAAHELELRLRLLPQSAVCNVHLFAEVLRDVASDTVTDVGDKLSLCLDNLRLLVNRRAL